ncbi:MAG: hypothetical protein HKN78_11560 [Sphingomonadaceae bacterium]|nr:hypothetical protein [Sphingomonadaceae bacterium]
MQNGARLPSTIILAVFACVAIPFAVAGYELAAFGWHPAREEPALYTAYHWARMAVSASLALLLCWALARHLRPQRAEPMTVSELRFAAASLVGAAAMLGLLVADPLLFNQFSAEDHLLEWASALLLFGGTVFCLAAAARRAGRNRSAVIDSVLALGFAGLFFLIGMEEISWGQRVFGFDTPDAVAEMNWQGEFNLHNIQTDLSELAFYLGTGVFLIILPLMRGAIGDWPPFRRFEAFVPSRAVAAASAPMLFLSYGHWNLLPIQMLTMIGALAMLAFARSARTNGCVGEALLFTLAALLVAIGQIAILILGPTMVEIFDATEYREFFIALGLAMFGYELARRPNDRIAHAD